MRILKRNLAFMLVMALALGMMVTASAANVEDYKDANDITFVEAVDTLTALGILEGEDGTFHPERTLTREEGAKIVTYLMLGADAADNLSTSVAPFSDVEAGRWSAGYIAYCVSQGIVGGHGDGTFAPTDTLTATQFVKMLLCALGYGKNNEFTGPNWEIETNKTALTEGVYDGNLGANFSSGVKREEAAQYAFNALANTMEVNYSDVFGAYYSGQIFNDSKGFERKYTLGYRLYKLTKAGATDAFVRPAHFWKLDGKTITDIYADEADVTYTKAPKISDIYKDLGLKDKIASGNVTVCIDGDELDAGVDYTAFDIDGKNTDSIAKSDKYGLDGDIGNGSKVEIYYDDVANTVEIVVINTYLAQVVDYDDNVVTVTAVDGTNLKDGEFDTAYEYEEDDYVLITIAGDEVMSVKPVNVVEGELDSLSATASRVKFDGENHDFAKKQYNLSDSSDVEGDEVSFDNTYELFVDDYGYAIALNMVDEGDSNTIGYVYVTKTQSRSNNILDSSAAVAEIRYLNGDGTEVLPLETKKINDELCFKLNGAKTGDGDEVEKNNWVNVSVLNDADGNADDKDNKSAYLAGQFFAYSINSSDELVLKKLKDSEKSVDGTVDTNGGTQGTLGGEAVRFNSNSVVNSIDKNDKVNSYTGYKNIKLSNSNSVPVLLILSGDRSDLVKEAYILSDVKAKGTENIYAYFNGKVGSNSNGDEVQLYVDGSAQWYQVAEGEDAPNKDDKGLYLVTFNSDDEVSSIEKLTVGENGDDGYTYTEGVTITEAESSYFSGKIGEGENKTYIYADDCKVFSKPDTKFVSKNTIKAAVLDSENNPIRSASVVSIVENDEDEVVFVLVTKVPAAVSSGDAE